MSHRRKTNRKHKPKVFADPLWNETLWGKTKHWSQKRARSCQPGRTIWGMLLYGCYHGKRRVYDIWSAPQLNTIWGRMGGGPQVKKLLTEQPKLGIFRPRKNDYDFCHVVTIWGKLPLWDGRAALYYPGTEPEWMMSNLLPSVYRKRKD